MCHHRDSDWYAERRRDRADEREGDETPDYADELGGREVEESEVADPEFEEGEMETPELADDEAERPAATPSDD